MLHVYTQVDGRLELRAGQSEAIAAIWFDLLNPTQQEIAAVKGRLSIEVPTRAEMEEIELSSRLYAEDDALFMTVTALAQVDTDSPVITPVTFILAGETLVTVRYAEPKSFIAFTNRALRLKGALYASGEEIMLGLLEAIIDRTADILERLGAETDTLSHEVFKKGKAKADKNKRDLELVITQIGQKAELLTLVQESLLSMSRVVAYHAAVRKGFEESREERQVSRLIQRDAGQLGEHAQRLSGRLDFLLNATLGLINLEQNDIFRRFSIISIVYLAPTLVGAIYGMNFAFMPELNWMFGYPVALGLMVAGAVLPALYFRRRGWF